MALTQIATADFSEHFGLSAARNQYIKTYAFGVPSEDALALIKQLSGGRILELGAGTGYWAMLLAERGVDVIAVRKAFDGYPFGSDWSYVKEIDGEDAVKFWPDRDVLTVWPCFATKKSWIWRAAKKMVSGRKLFYGTDSLDAEVGGEATGCPHFRDLLREEFTEIARLPLPHWRGLNDHLLVYQKR